MNTPAFVVLAHGSNPDIPGGYWGAKPRGGRVARVSVTSFEQASKVCRDYLDTNALGSGNWAGGEVYDAQSKQIAHVSFNGRVWDNDGKEIKPRD